MNYYNEKLIQAGLKRAKAYAKEMEKLGVNKAQFAKIKGISRQRLIQILDKLK